MEDVQIVDLNVVDLTLGLSGLVDYAAYVIEAVMKRGLLSMRNQ